MVYTEHGDGAMALIKIQRNVLEPPPIRYNNKSAH